MSIVLDRSVKVTHTTKCTSIFYTNVVNVMDLSTSKKARMQNFKLFTATYYADIYGS